MLTDKCTFEHSDSTVCTGCAPDKFRCRHGMFVAVKCRECRIENQTPFAETSVRNLLACLDEDTEREGLKDTPRRVVAMLKELLHKEPFVFTTFDAEGMDQMVIQSNIPLQSLCEHHILPFMGTAAVAYIPDGRIVGLSKLTRAVKFCSAGLQNQERITKAIADMLETHLHPKGVGVVIRARHLCMELRGVSAPNVYTTTSEMRGALRDNAAARAEFMELAR